MSNKLCKSDTKVINFHGVLRNFTVSLFVPSLTLWGDRRAVQRWLVVSVAILTLVVYKHPQPNRSTAIILIIRIIRLQSSAVQYFEPYAATTTTATTTIIVPWCGADRDRKVAPWK